MVVQRIRARNEMSRALEQILQAQQGPDALVERILVRNDGQTRLAKGRKCEDSELFSRATQIEFYAAASLR
jgi:hypothetical protein